MEQRKNHHSGSNGGFLLGVIIGVLITLLFTTKKGREILKELTEKGLDKFSDLEKRLQQTEEDEFDTFEEDDENDYVKPDQPTRHLADAQTKIETKKDTPVVHKTVEVKETPPQQVPEEHKKPEPVHESKPAVEHTPEVQKEIPKKSSPVRRFFRLKK